MEKPARAGLLLGYAASEGRQIREAVRRLGVALKDQR
jgi:hypothetical protein